MSMTREEAINRLEKLIAIFETASTESKMIDYSGIIDALKFSLTNLRVPTREMVERMFPGCDNCRPRCGTCEISYAWDRYGKPNQCTDCKENKYKNYTPESQYCEYCGKPLTDEAVDMMMERMQEIWTSE